ncbi:MAG: hypothetical protein HYR96_07420 [Deltaproteobacteria bacterium]|nr:hypothetical protein [Deltaproteobacteria bacterium]MBI3294191.1 hypothetical protein [Deltaproteobacteria bacterium]
MEQHQARLSELALWGTLLMLTLLSLRLIALIPREVFDPTLAYGGF